MNIHLEETKQLVSHIINQRNILYGLLKKIKDIQNECMKNKNNVFWYKKIDEIFDISNETENKIIKIENENKVLKSLMEERKEIINTINCMSKYAIYQAEKLEKEKL